jgi:phenylpyruvate tautomerase
LYSIGAIAKESNGAITNSVTEILADVPENRIYINFFDVPRANVGWSRKTFAG